MGQNSVLKRPQLSPKDEQYLEGAEKGDYQGGPHVQLPPAGVEEPRLVGQQPQARHHGPDHGKDAELWYRNHR